MAAPLSLKSFIEFVLIIKIIAFVAFSCDFGECFGLHAHNFSTKTTYDASFYPSELEIRNIAETPYPPHCDPLHLDVLLRHGIRNPGNKDIARLLKLQNRMDQELGNERVPQMIMSWQNRFPNHEDKLIASRGKTEHQHIAQRMAKRFMNFLQTSDEYTFVTSETNRTIESCVSFFSGLNESGLNIQTQCTKDNSLLRFFDTCKKYLHLGSKGGFKKERDIFMRTDTFKLMIESFKDRHDIPDTFHLSSSELKSLYVVSATEHAVFGDSVLSDIFVEEEIAVMEYFIDLRSYWKRSYGFEINYDMSCVLLEDIFKRMGNVLNSSSSAAVFRFAHAETTLPMLTILGLFKDDDPLLGTNFASHRHRAFRTSRISAFSTNIAFVLLKCSQATSEADETGGEFGDEYMVQVLFNELPIRLPFCDDDLCPLATVRDKLKKHIEQCDFDSLCALPHDEL